MNLKHTCKLKGRRYNVLPRENKLDGWSRILPDERKLDGWSRMDGNQGGVDAGGVVDYSAIRSSPSGALPHPYDAEELVES